MAWFTLEDAKTSFSLFCCVYGIGTLGMPANFARAGPVYATLALSFMAIANIYASVALSKVMLVAPPDVKTYGDVGEWAMGTTGRLLVNFSQIGVCLMIPCAFLVLGGSLLQTLFPGTFSSTFWIAFMAMMVLPICMVPTLKEGAAVAFIGCMATLVSDAIAIGVLLHEMKGHPRPPHPQVTIDQVLTTFGNLSLAYGAANIIPDLQRQHSEPERMPRIIFVTLSLISLLFLLLAGSGYSAAGCQLSGNLLFTITGNNGEAKSSLGFTAFRGSVVMAYIFMQLHITIAFSVILHPAFFMAERLLLNMHQPTTYVDVEMSKPVTPSATSKSSETNCTTDTEEVDSNVPGHHATDESHDYRVLHYVALRFVIVTLLVFGAIVLQDHFLELTDFIGASTISMSCLILPIVFYLKVFNLRLPAYERNFAFVTAFLCGFFGIYVILSLFMGLIKSGDVHTLPMPTFAFCPVQHQYQPYYHRTPNH